MDYTPLPSWENPGIVNTALLTRGLSTNEYPLNDDFNFMYYALVKGINLAGGAILKDDAFKFDATEFPIASASLTFDEESVTVTTSDDDSLRIVNPSGKPTVGYVKVLVATKTAEGSSSKVLTDVVISGKLSYGSLSRKVPIKEIIDPINASKYDRLIYDDTAEVSQSVPVRLGAFFSFDASTPDRELDFPVSIPSGCSILKLGDLRVHVGRVVPPAVTVSSANYSKVTSIMREYSNIPTQATFPSVVGSARMYGFAGSYPNGSTYVPGTTSLASQVGVQMALTPVRTVGAVFNNKLNLYPNFEFPVNYLLTIGMDATNVYDDSEKRTSFGYSGGVFSSSSSTALNYYQLVTQEVLDKKIVGLYTEEMLLNKAQDELVLKTKLDDYVKTSDTASWQKTRVTADNYGSSAVNGSSWEVLIPLMDNLVNNGKVMERGLLYDVYPLASVANLVSAYRRFIAVEPNDPFTDAGRVMSMGYGVALMPYRIDSDTGRLLDKTNPDALRQILVSGSYYPSDVIPFTGLDYLGDDMKMKAVYNANIDTLIIQFKGITRNMRMGSGSTTSAKTFMPSVVMYVKNFSARTSTVAWLRENMTLRLYYNRGTLLDTPYTTDSDKFNFKGTDLLSSHITNVGKLMTNMQYNINVPEAGYHSFGELLFDGDLSEIGTGIMVYLRRSPLEYTHFKILYRITGYEGYITVPRAMATTGGRFTVNNAYRNMGDTAPHVLTVFQPQIQISASVETVTIDPFPPSEMYALTFTHLSKWYMNTSTEVGGAYTTNTTMRLLKVIGISNEEVPKTWSPTDFGLRAIHTI